MTNKDIAKTFQYLGNIMELHGENPFKIRSYSNAYNLFRKLPTPLSEMTEAEISNLKGVGKAISGKIRELLETGEMATLKKYEEMTPEGIREMLHIRGFGPKKVRVIWKELGAESIGELLYACNENRLFELKGFGQKTQEDLKQKLEYFQKSKNKFHYAALEQEANDLVGLLKGKLPEARISLTGAIRRRCNVLESIEILIGTDNGVEQIFDNQLLIKIDEKDGPVNEKTKNELPVKIYHCPKAEFGSKLLLYSAEKEFLYSFLKFSAGNNFKGLSEEKAVFEKAGLPFIEPELREAEWTLPLAQKNQLPKLIEESDIKGVVHNHTTYSDGLHSLREMAEYARSLGYEYIVISDHSQAAFYANGLQPERVLQQMAEIDELNKKLAPFQVFKSIESDILNDGSLDYEEDILKQFDLVIASIHSNLRMDLEKATHRLIAAIENPYTTILGHPTGRLLLSRKGYPIDYQKVIDACAANGVSIELNANPYRLDLDWRWIHYTQEKGVLLSINPDAHSTVGIHDIHLGLLSARKGGLTKEGCLNAFGLKEFEKFLFKS